MSKCLLAEVKLIASYLDIERAANLLIKKHGGEAPIQAAMQADAMLVVGDIDGCAEGVFRIADFGGFGTSYTRS